MFRRIFLLAVLGFGLALICTINSFALADEIDVEAILRDPEAPAAGNPNGDITIVAFLDYNCPFCKKSIPGLEKLVKTDSKIRVVYKDWPILSEASVYGAEMALAAKYQGKYEIVHAALMNIPGGKITQSRMREAIKSSKVNIGQLEDDLKIHHEEILALLKRNKAQAESMGLKGTPVFLIGPFKVAAALDYEGFKQVVKDSRDRLGAN